jgi:hypothetical protein
MRSSTTGNSNPSQKHLFTKRAWGPYLLGASDKSPVTTINKIEDSGFILST